MRQTLPGSEIIGLGPGVIRNAWGRGAVPAGSRVAGAKPMVPVPHLVVGEQSLRVDLDGHGVEG